MKLRLSMGLAMAYAWGCATTGKTADMSPEGASAATEASAPFSVAEEPRPQGADGTVSTPAVSPSPSAPFESPTPQPEVETYPPEVERSFVQAYEASKQGDYDSAEQALLEALRTHRKTPMAFTNLGVIYEKRGQLDKAEEYYRSAIALKPEQPHAWDNLTRLLLRQNRAVQIDKEIRTALANSPSALGPRLALALLLVHQKRPIDAEAEIKAVLKRDEKNVRAMEILAQTYYLQGKYELARLVLENARALAPQQATVHNLLGLVNLALKAKLLALENFKEATTLEPAFVEALNNHASLLLEQQDFESAASHLEKAVGLAPDFVVARLNLANAYRGLLQPEKALPLYEEVVRQAPQRVDVYFHLAVLYLDAQLPQLTAVDRLKTSLRYFDEFEGKGGNDERVAGFRKDAQKSIEKEERKKEREKRDALKRAEESSSNTPSSEETTP